MSSLKIMSCNVCGLAETIKRKQLFDHFRKKKVDIVLIQESRSSKRKARIWQNQWGGKIIYTHGETNTRGAAILFAKNLEFKVLYQKTDDMGHMIICKIQIDQMKLAICNIYAPNEDDPGFFANVMHEIQNISNVDCTIWGGDFNTHLGPEDTKGKFVFTKTNMLINEYLENEKWIDVWRYLNPEDF